MYPISWRSTMRNNDNSHRECERGGRLVTTLTAGLVSACLLILAGCETLISPEDVKCPPISVSENGLATIGTQKFKVSDMGKKLKSLGVPKTTIIHVSVYKDIPQSMEHNIGRALASSGYRRFALVEPKEVTVSTSTNSTSAGSYPASGTKRQSTTTTSSRKSSSSQ